MAISGSSDCVHLFVLGWCSLTLMTISCVVFQTPEVVSAIAVNAPKRAVGVNPSLRNLPGGTHVSRVTDLKEELKDVRACFVFTFVEFLLEGFLRRFYKCICSVVL